MVIVRRVSLVILLSLLTACCQVQPRRELPAAISGAEQARRLNAWSRAMQRVRASSVPLGVRIDYLDEGGNKKSQNAEGTLVIEQHEEEHGGANVLLLGKAFDQPVFEAGRNAEHWWFLIRLDTKTAWVGDSTKAVVWPVGGETKSSSILRADLVPELLGLVPVPENAGMTADDATGTNHVVISAGGHAERELIVDRYTNELREVRIFNAGGVVMVSARLEDYHTVEYADGLEKPVPVPKFPHVVTVYYAAQKMTVALQFGSVLVPDHIAASAFRMNTEGLKVVTVD